MVNFTWGDGKIAMVGGLIINTPDEHEDLFMPIDFKVMTKDKVDLINFKKWK